MLKMRTLRRYAFIVKLDVLTEDGLVAHISVSNGHKTFMGSSTRLQFPYLVCSLRPIPLQWCIER